MPLDFPASPSLNDTYSFGGKTWIWTGEYWRLNTAGAINDIPIGNVTASTGNFTTITGDSAVFSGNVTASYFIGDGSLLTGISGGSGSFGVDTLDFTGDGSTTEFTITAGYTANTVMVFENGVSQTPGTDYTVSGNVLTFISAPGSGVSMQTRLFSGGSGNAANVDLSAVAQDIIPAANITYDLGSANLRWRDLYLSGNTIDLGGAKIKSDATEGTIALIPTVVTGNTKAIVIGQRGISTVSADERGEISAEAIAEAAGTANTVTGNLISERVLSDSYFFGNGDPLLSAAALKVVRRSHQPLSVRMASGAKIEIIGRSGNVFVDITV